MRDIAIRVISVDSPEFREALRLREEVFVREQGIRLDQEIDGRDADAVHVVALRAGKIIGTLRLLDAPASLRVGRVCVRASERTRGVGSLLMQSAEQYARAHAYERMTLLSQVQVIPFYERMGFVAEDAHELDAGIPSVWMHKNLPPATS